MFDLSRSVETLTALVGSAGQSAPQAAEILGLALTRAGLDSAIVETLQARATQVFSEPGIDAAGLPSDTVGRLISQLSNGLPKPP